MSRARQQPLLLRPLMRPWSRLPRRALFDSVYGSCHPSFHRWLLWSQASASEGCRRLRRRCCGRSLCSSSSFGRFCGSHEAWP